MESDKECNASIYGSECYVVSERPRAYGIVSSALEGLGLPAETTIQELDELVRAGRLVCLCGNPKLPRRRNQVGLSS